MLKLGRIRATVNDGLQEPGRTKWLKIRRNPPAPISRSESPPPNCQDGGKLAGHVGEEAVLLVRRGADIFAIGAQCTHYNGPLAEGLIVDDTVRCPWHHACFDLRTGEALRAPALSPVDTWRVETARRQDLRAREARPAREEAARQAGRTEARS